MYSYTKLLILLLIICTHSWNLRKNNTRFNIKPQLQGKFEKSKLGFELVMFYIMFKPGLYFFTLDLTKTKVLPGSRTFCDSGFELNVQINQKVQHLERKNFKSDIFWPNLRRTILENFSYRAVISISDVSCRRGRYDHAFYYISPNLSRKGRYIFKMVHRKFGQKKVALQIFFFQ